MKRQKGTQEKSGITRREFIQYSAAAGAALAMPRFLAGCSDSGSSTSSGTEYRTYYFDLSHGNPSHNFYLKAAGQYLKLRKMDPETLKAARQANPFLSLIPDGNITHYTKDIPLSAQNICLCWIVGQDPSILDGSWSMALMFYHLPHSALRAATQRPGAIREPCANKFKRYGIAPAAV
ncbi:twin-arginine translocation signal domain-containing protein, partial [Desulfosarcina sp.]|uniref:twin-arginine translocation signal domain-containing protein n=1 Tax=Desulfosarcina sp. TaxID=2027861 RepID=UPI003970BCF1